jgi:hypothetical protein
MKRVYSSKVLFNAAALLTFASSIAYAQDSTKSKPRSSRRIPISKEAPGDMATTARTDTVTVYKTDTLRLSTTTPPRVDTVRTTNTVTVHDTVTVAPVMKPMRLPGGLYFGLGGGVMAPNGSIYNPNNSGPTVQAQLGWQGAKNVLGLRIDGNWNRPGQDAAYAAYQVQDPTIINVNGDVKLNLPFFTHLVGLSPRFNLYGIGGGSYINYKNLPIRITAPGGVGPANVAPGVDSWESHWGWNAGGGASLAFGRTEVFFETRVIAWTTDASPQARQMPFVLGVNLY